MYDAYTWLATLPTAVQTFLGARNGKGDVYAYDRAYRMVDARYDVTNPQTEVNSPGSQTYVQLVGYTLDGLGNRSQVQTTLWGGAPATTTYASDVVNQYTAVGGVTRTHDSNGNLTDDGTHQYLYDFKNRLVEVKLKSSGATVSTYRYDARGRRVEKDVGGTVTRYILEGVTVVEEFDGTDTWQASYIHGDRIDHPCAMDRADIADVDGDSNTTEVLRFHYAQNALGSVSEMTSPSGAVVEWVTYDVYGLPTVRDQNGNVVASSAVGNPFLYTGREWDVEFGKYFYRARTYDPEKGRFLQRDPLGHVDGLGLHEYSRNAPTVLTDPLGTWTEVIEAAFNAFKDDTGLDMNGPVWQKIDETFVHIDSVRTTYFFLWFLRKMQRLGRCARHPKGPLTGPTLRPGGLPPCGCPGKPPISIDDVIKWKTPAPLPAATEQLEVYEGKIPARLRKEKSDADREVRRWMSELTALETELAGLKLQLAVVQIAEALSTKKATAPPQPGTMPSNKIEKDIKAVEADMKLFKKNLEKAKSWQAEVDRKIDAHR